MTFYTDMAEVAAELLTEFGQAVTLKRSTGTVDPVTGADTRSTSDVTTVGVVMNYPQAIIDGTRIQSGDRRLMIDASEEPKLTDTVLIGSEPWSIQEIEVSSPAGTAIRYAVRIRK